MLFLAVLMYMLWSTIFPLTKMTLVHAPPLFLTGTRMAIAGLILLAFLAIRNWISIKINLKQFLSLSVLALFSVYLANMFECWGLQQLTAAKTCFIFSLGPFFSALFSYIHFGEVMNRRKWIGMLIGFGGILPVLFMQKGGNELLTSVPLLSWAELSAMAASLCAVYGWVILRKIVMNISPTLANGWSMLIGGAFALIHSLVVDSWTPIPVARSEWLGFGEMVFIMIFISNLLCYNLYGALLKRFTATLLSFLGLFSPIFASLSSWAILGEPLSGLSACSSPLRCSFSNAASSSQQ